MNFAIFVRMIFRALSRLYFRISGWKLQGELPAEVRKCVMVAAPHTSNWDFPIARATFFLLKIPVKFLAKKELFFFPFGTVLKALGGIPINRKKSNNLVEEMTKMLKENDELVLLIPAEGTRKPVKKWKSGFYYTALNAGVPIVLGFMDYKEKIAGIGPVIYPTGDYDKDIAEIKDFFKDKTPKHPENFRY